ncbi:KpsF/GutQ family sugar-phosphate isomerase [Dongshaea marina]|uniref:KpsF/GutQ family sugar-phosphate isomerase n=1 Tax=Dongshaea marina TaxID=2047966 RepID=UPI000D3E6FF1|nr:KpsF/GutQ family sugar-phosphate isomerase [Dongshaea marina]
MKQAINFCETARRVIDIEKAAIEHLYSSINGDFSKACELLLQCQGKVVVTGMGKSGHIARKIAASLASTGTPSFFMHPGEASHGDLGMISPQDVVIALSYSGESNEILALLPVIKRWNVPLVCITGNPESTMAQEAHIHLNASVEKEACPLGLAPTASTTVALVLGDALAVTLLEARGFREADFALSHPGGALGRRLLIRVSDIMHQGAEIPCVPLHASITETLLEMSGKGLGMVCILNPDGTLAGLYTDGDLRRTLNQEHDLHSTQIREVMTPGCITICDNLLAAEAVKLMEEKKINGLIVVDPDHKPVGIFNMLDLVKARVM